VAMILRRAWAIVRGRPGAYLQLLATLLVCTAAVDAALQMAALGGGNFAGPVEIGAGALFLAVFAFGYGGALGAMAEAARGEPPSPLWRRGARLWGRTLGLFAIDVVFLVALLIITGLVLVAAGAPQAIAAAGGVLSMAAGPALARAVLVLLLTALVLYLAVGPWLQAAQATLFVGGRAVLDAMGGSFAGAYSRRQIGYWLMVLGVALLLDLGSAFGESLLGSAGTVASLILSPALLWVVTALAFATYQVRGTQP